MNIQPSSLSAKMFRRRKETSLQCRRILGGRKLLGYVRTVAEPPSCYDGGRVGRVKIVTLRVGAKAKEGKRGGPFPPSFRVSTCALASPKKTHALQAEKKPSLAARARRDSASCIRRLKFGKGLRYANALYCRPMDCS